MLTTIILFAAMLSTAVPSLAAVVQRTRFAASDTSCSTPLSLHVGPVPNSDCIVQTGGGSNRTDCDPNSGKFNNFQCPTSDCTNCVNVGFFYGADCGQLAASAARYSDICAARPAQRPVRNGFGFRLFTTSDCSGDGVGAESYVPDTCISSHEIDTPRSFRAKLVSDGAEVTTYGDLQCGSPLAGTSDSPNPMTYKGDGTCNRVGGNLPTATFYKAMDAFNGALAPAASLALVVGALLVASLI